jgi:hypothetical protein
MTNVWKWFTTIAVASGVAAIVAAPAEARGMGGMHGGGPLDGMHGGGPFGGGHGGGPFGGGHGGGPGTPPNSPCIQNCRMTDRLCDDSARSDAQACKQSTCSSERQAVVAACVPDPTVAACQTAQSALHTCLQPCLTTFQTAVSTCRTAEQACGTACGSSVPSQPDPQCVIGCRSTLQACRLTAGTTGHGCFADCSALITTAETDCGTDPTAPLCSSDLQAAQACVRPCLQAEQTAVQSCLQAAQSCIAACPSATPTPTP